MGESRLARAEVDGAVERVVGAVRATPALVPGLVAIFVALVWSALDGATDPLVWIPGGLVIVGLLVVVVVAIPGGLSVGRAGGAAIVLLAAFVVWCFASILWADVEGDAWAGATQTLVYGALFTLFAISPWRPRAVAYVLGTYAVGVAVIGNWAFLTLDSDGHLEASFIEGRLVEPISYANANCGLFVSAGLAALVLASARQTSGFVRGALLASAGTLAELALLTQSRMSLLAVPLTIVLLLVLVRRRARLVVAMIVVALVVAASASSLLDVYAALLDETGVQSAVDVAQRALVLSAIALFAVGICWSVVDRRLVVSSQLARLGTIAAVAGSIVVVGAGMAAFLVRYGSPFDQADVWWERFKADETVYDPSTPHLVSGFGGAGRYQIWSVALDLFRERPLTGIGVDNFDTEWLRRRPTDRDLTYPHSVELRLLQQTGLIGTALFVGFLACVSAAGWGAVRRRGDAQLAAAAAVVVFAYWMVHGSIDWLWEIPALAAPAFASLGLLVGLDAGRRRNLSVGAVRLLVALVAAVALVSLVPPWLAEREVRAAVATSRSPLPGPFAHVDRARTLNPFSEEPDLVGALIAADRGDVRLQRTLLERALERNPHNWYPYVELGLLEARGGHRAQALRWLTHAKLLNPLDRTIQFALDRTRAGNPPSQSAMNDLYVRTADLCCRP